MNIDALKQQRFAFLHKFWELTGGNQNKLIRIGEVAKPLNLNEESAKVIVQYLHGEDLVDATTHGFAVSTYFDVGLYIKHKGIKETEQALSKPDLETEHFPAKVVNYINIGSMNNSNISQGSTNSNQ